MEIKKFLNYLQILENRARYKLIKHHEKSMSFYNKKMINDILYNEPTHYVEEFKEYLIYEDYNEFLKKYYKKSEIKFELLSTLMFYEKNSKIYPNYTVISESKYMYKNIKRKQKIIDQMQENNDNKSNYPEYSANESLENISKTVFNSSVMNSIYNKSNTNRKELKNNSSTNTNGSINRFLGAINNIEKNIHKKLNNHNIANLKNKNLKSSAITNNKKKFNKFASIVKKLPVELVTSKQNQSNINNNYNKKCGNNTNRLNNGELNPFNKIFNQKVNINRKSNDNNFNEINKNKNSKIANANIAYITSYKTKFNNCILICNNSLNNDNTKNSSNSIQKFHKKKSLSTNMSKQQISSALLKHKKINSKNIQNYQVNNINKKIFDENLVNEKLFLSTNSSYSPKVISNNIISSSTSQKNSQKKNNFANQKQTKNISLSKQLTLKKGKSNGLNNYNSTGNSITTLSSKAIENQKLKSMANNILIKKTKKKFNEQYNPYQGNKANLINYVTYVNKQHKKPETYRNYCHSKILSARNSKPKNNNVNKLKNKFITKPKLISSKNKNNQKSNNSNSNKNNKLFNKPISPNNSSKGFYYNSNIINNFNKNNKNINSIDLNQVINVNKTNDNKNTNTNTNTSTISNINSKNKNKNKTINNYKIVNNINNNTTQISIYTGRGLYRYLRYNNNSTFNSSNILSSNFTLSGYPIKKADTDLKKVISVLSSSNSINTNVDEKEKSLNLKDLKNIIHKQIIDNENDYMITSERQLANKRLFDKLGKCFTKHKTDNKLNENYFSVKINKIKNKHFNNTNNYFNNSQISINDNKKVNKLKCVNAKIPNKNITNKNTFQRKKNISPDFIDIQDNDLTKITNMMSNRQSFKNKINKLKYLKKDDECKFTIHSERNKMSKILFK